MFCHAGTIEFEAHQPLTRQAAGEEAAAPTGKLVAAVKGEPGGGNDRRPLHDGIFHSGGGCLVADGCPAVVDAVRHSRPTVVGAFTDEIEFVPAARSVFGRPESSVCRIVNQALRVARSQGPNGGHGSRRVDKGIVGRDSSIIANAVDFPRDLAEVLRGILRGGRPSAVPDAEEKMAASVKGQPAPEMGRAGLSLIGGRIENGFDAGEACAVQFAADDGGVRASAEWFGEGQIDPAIFVIIRMKHDIEESALTASNHIRNTGNLARFRAGGGEK